MAVTAADLAAEIGVTVTRATAILAAVTELVSRYAPDAPKRSGMRRRSGPRDGWRRRRQAASVGRILATSLRPIRRT